jgi:hypothetical protein
LRANDLREESINNHQGTNQSGYQVIVQQMGLRRALLQPVRLPVRA